MGEFTEFVREMERVHQKDSATRHLLKVEKLVCEGNIVHGVINVGPYGFGADLVHSETFARSHRQTPQEATLHPYYFLLHAPEASTKAVLILQRFGGRGIQTLLTTRLRESFRFRNPGFVLDIHTHIPGSVLKHLFEGHIRTINIRSYKVPSDLASKVQFDGNIEEKAVFRQVIEARKGDWVPRPKFMQPGVLRDILYGKRSLAEMLDDDAKGTVDEMKITVVYGGNQRTIDLAHPERIMPYIDISGEVNLAADGHPNFEDVHASASALLRDVLTEMGRAHYAG